MAPEPMAPFIDAFLPGDAEDTLPGFLDAAPDLLRSSLPRGEVLAALSRIRGVYVPSLYEPAKVPPGGPGGSACLKKGYPKG